MMDSIVLATVFSCFIKAIWQVIEVKLYGRIIEREIDTLIICIVWICLYIVSIISKEL